MYIHRKKCVCMCGIVYKYTQMFPCKLTLSESALLLYTRIVLPLGVSLLLKYQLVRAWVPFWSPEHRWVCHVATQLSTKYFLLTFFRFAFVISVLIFAFLSFFVFVILLLGDSVFVGVVALGEGTNPCSLVSFAVTDRLLWSVAYYFFVEQFSRV